MILILFHINVYLYETLCRESSVAPLQGQGHSGGLTVTDIICVGMSADRKKNSKHVYMSTLI